MYQTECDKGIVSVQTIPENILEDFRKSKHIGSRTILPWGEHCTECQWPVCYKTCELYTPRFDGECRLFRDGVVRINYETEELAYLMKITFKQWGKLWTEGNTRMISITKAKQIEKRDVFIGNAVQSEIIPEPLRRKLVRLRGKIKKHTNRYYRKYNETPSHLMIECYNPGDTTIETNLIIQYDQKKTLIPFIRSLNFSPGYKHYSIDANEILRIINIKKPFKIEITPNGTGYDKTLIFGMIDFVNKTNQQKKKAKKFKCIVWDLDNTLWNGVLVEKGLKGIVLKEGVADLIKELDQRGIINTVASKNNHEEAMQALRHFQLEKYFVGPQISWEPKSKSISKIISLLNIGVDTFLFVDDQQFEREEVKAVFPEINLLDALEYKNIIKMKEVQVPITEESKQRRHFYKEQINRIQAQEVYAGDYFKFLKDCKIKLNISNLKQENINRVYELAQRTNQMNFSGNRYSKNELQKIKDNSNLIKYVLDCEDKYGNYGIIGFAIVDKTEPRLIDLMFSCRVQSKRVEHAFIFELLKKHFENSEKPFYATYRKTERNEHSGKVFEDIGFRIISKNDNVLNVEIKKDFLSLNDELINIFYA